MSVWHRPGENVQYDNPGPTNHPIQIWTDPQGMIHKFRRHHIWGHMGILTRLIPGDYREYGTAELILAGWRRVPTSPGARSVELDGPAKGDRFAGPAGEGL